MRVRAWPGGQAAVRLAERKADGYRCGAATPTLRVNEEMHAF